MHSVTESGRSVLIACGLLPGESTKSSELFFRAIHRVVGSPLAGAVLIADMSLAQLRAVERIWPSVRVPWCVYHLVHSLAKRKGAFRHNEEYYSYTKGFCRMVCA